MHARLIAIGVVLVAAAIAAVLIGTRSGDEAAAKDPAADPRAFAVDVVRLIVRNRYGEAWGALHPVDRQVASKGVDFRANRCRTEPHAPSPTS